MEYGVNSLLEWKRDSGKAIIERVLWIENEFVYVIDVNKNNAPDLRYTIEINEALKEKTLQIIYNKDPYMVVVGEDTIPERYKKIRDRAWSLIREIACDEPKVFLSSYRRKAVRRIADKNDISEQALYGYLKKYWKGGKQPNALLPNYHKCGGLGKTKKAGTVKRGRPRQHPEVVGEGINITDEIKKVFRTAINRFYYTTAKNSLALTYELMLKEYFVADYTIENGLKIPVIKPQTEIPTFGQFRYFYEKQQDIRKEITSRYSNKKFQKQFRQITGNVMDGVIQPGIFEIDCQVADVYLVSSFNRNWVIGRPALYICIDKFSRLVAGVYVGLETGSYVGAAMALLNTSSNKVRFCKEYGIEIEEKVWPAHHLPQAIIADRGELESKNIEALVGNLGVTVHNAPPYRADWKSSVERFFGLTNERVKPFLPGVVDLDGRERGDKDYRLSAKLTLYEFTKIMIKCIVFHNNQYNLNNYKRDENMLEDNVPLTPVEIWNWGISNRGGALRIVPEDVIKIALMPTENASVTAKGVRYKDMYYASKSMLKDQVFARARSKGIWKVKISYDPRNLNYIYVHGQSPNEYEKCFLLDGESRYKNKTIEEIEYLLQIEKIQKIRSKHDEVQAKTQLITEIEEIVKKAEADYKGEREIEDSDRKRVKNIRHNRQLEKTANRVREAFEIEKAEDIGKEVTFDDKELGNLEEENGLELLMRKQKEGLSKAYGKDNDL